MVPKQFYFQEIIAMPRRLAIIIGGSALLAAWTLVVLHLKFIIAMAALVILFLFLSQVFCQDRLKYWTAVYLLCLPIAAPKTLFGKESLMNILEKMGTPMGAAPGAVVFISDLFLVMLFFTWLIRLRRQRQTLNVPLPAWLFLLFIAWSGLSLINSINLTYSGFEILRLVKFFTIYLLFANLATELQDLKLIMICLFIGIFIQGIITSLNYYLQIDFSLFGNFINTDSSCWQVDFEGEEKIRGFGTVGPHNIQALYFELLLPLIASISIIIRNKMIKIFCLLVFISGFIGLIYTFSKGALIGVVIGLILVFILLTIKNMVARKFMTIFMISFLIISPLILNITSNYFANREGTFQNRLEMMAVGWKMIRTHPLLGFGINTSVIHVPRFDPEEVTLAGYPVHSYFLVVASEVGIIGLIMLLSFYAYSLNYALRAMKSRDAFIAAVSIGIFCGLLGGLIHMGWDMGGGAEVIQSLLMIFLAFQHH